METTGDQAEWNYIEKISTRTLHDRLHAVGITVKEVVLVATISENRRYIHRHYVEQLLYSKERDVGNVSQHGLQFNWKYYC